MHLSLMERSAAELLEKKGRRTSEVASALGVPFREAHQLLSGLPLVHEMTIIGDTDSMWFLERRPEGW